MSSITRSSITAIEKGIFPAPQEVVQQIYPVIPLFLEPIFELIKVEATISAGSWYNYNVNQRDKAYDFAVIAVRVDASASINYLVQVYLESRIYTGKGIKWVENEVTSTINMVNVIEKTMVPLYINYDDGSWIISVNNKDATVRTFTLYIYVLKKPKLRWG